MPRGAASVSHVFHNRGMGLEEFLYFSGGISFVEPGRGMVCLSQEKEEEGRERKSGAPPAGIGVLSAPGSFIPHDETIGLKFYNILCRTNNDDTRCSEKGLQLQLFYNFCLKADGFRRAKMKGKSAF